MSVLEVVFISADTTVVLAGIGVATVAVMWRLGQWAARKKA